MVSSSGKSARTQMGAGEHVTVQGVHCSIGPVQYVDFLTSAKATKEPISVGIVIPCIGAGSFSNKIPKNERATKTLSLA